MTIQELYDWAKENNILDYEILIDAEFVNNGAFGFDEVKIIENYKEVIVTDCNCNFEEL